VIGVPDPTVESQGAPTCPGLHDALAAARAAEKAHLTPEPSPREAPEREAARDFHVHSRTRRFRIDISRSAVNLARSAFRMREKSAAAKPVRA